MCAVCAAMLLQVVDEEQVVLVDPQLRGRRIDSGVVEETSATPAPQCIFQDVRALLHLCS